MRFSMLYSGEQILSFKSCLVFYAGDSLRSIKGHHLNKLDSTRCRIPSFNVIDLSVTKKKIFKGFLPHMGVAAILVMSPGPFE